jgi:hypothetical protein
MSMLSRSSFVPSRATASTCGLALKPASLLALSLLALTGTANLAHAQIISSMPTNPGASTTTETNGSGILSVLDVGANPVTINSFGTFGNINAPGNLKWVIYTSLQAVGNPPVFSTVAVPTAASAVGIWNDSPAINFTLNANTRYQLGVIADQDFTYYYDAPSTAVSSGGLTLPSGFNGNTGGTFASPTLSTGGGVLESFRAFGSTSATPEPGTWAMFVGMTVSGGLFLKRRKRNSR